MVGTLLRDAVFRGRAAIAHVGVSSRVYVSCMKAITLWAVAWVTCASSAAAQLTIRLPSTTPVPAGRAIHVAGSFNAWNPSATSLTADSTGQWRITLPADVRGTV